MRYNLWSWQKENLYDWIKNFVAYPFFSALGSTLLGNQMLIRRSFGLRRLRSDRLILKARINRLNLNLIRVVTACFIVLAKHDRWGCCREVISKHWLVVVLVVVHLTFWLSKRQMETFKSVTLLLGNLSFLNQVTSSFSICRIYFKEANDIQCSQNKYEDE